MKASKAKKKGILALLAAAASSLVALILIIWLAASSERKKTEALVHTYAEKIANGVTAFFVDASTVASAASTLHSVQKLDWGAAGMEFTALIRATPYIHRISLVDRDGFIYDAYETGPAGNRWQGGKRTQNNSDPEAKPILVTEREYFRALVQENERGEFSVMLNEPFIPGGLSQKAFVTSVPIIKEGNAIGTVSVAQTALELSQLYEDLAMDFLDKFGDSAHLFLVSHDGQLVSNLEYNRTYGAYMDELFGETEIVPVSILGEDAVSGINAAVMDERLVIESAMKGRRHFFAGVKIEGTPFAVCIAICHSKMLYASRWILIIGLASILLSALCLVASRRAFKAAENEQEGEGLVQDGESPHAARPRKGHPPKGSWSMASQLSPPVLPQDDLDERHKR